MGLRESVAIYGSIAGTACKILQGKVKEQETDLERLTDIKKRKAWLREYEIGANDEPWF